MPDNPIAPNTDPELTPHAQGLIDSSPLREVDPNMADELLDRINNHMIEGTPEKITDETLDQLVSVYRKQALLWEVQQVEKPARVSRRKSPPGSQAVTLL